ncbi:S9 family peptidase [Mariniluteicoccus flavus]
MDSAQPPSPKHVDTVREHHGDRFVDPFEWLRDKENPEVLAHLEAENAWTEQQTAHLAELTEDIFEAVKARTKQTDLSVPAIATHTRDGAPVRYWYYTRTVEGSEYGLHCRALATSDTPPDPERPIAGEEVMLDGNAEAQGHEFFSIGAFAVSPDGRVLAYSVDHTGAERYTLRFRDLDTGVDRSISIDNTAWGLAWAGNDHVFYTRADESWRPHQVLRHRLGSPDGDSDPVVFTEDDERHWLDVTDSRDERFLVLSTASKLTSECWLLATDDPEGEFSCVAPRREGLEYEIEPAGDRLLIVHNGDGPDFALADAPLTATSTDDWRTVLPHRAGDRILGVDAYAGHAVASLRRDGLTALHVLPRNESGDLLPGRDVVFDEPIHTVSATGAFDYDATTIRLGYTSMVTPSSVLDLDLTTGETVLLKETPVLDHPTEGPYIRENYVQERVWAIADDGTRVPMSVVRHRDTPLDGTAPALIYGYGSYEVSMDPYFSFLRLSFLDRGFVYAIAHVRGGGELGRHWYDEGKMLAKTNTFTDFIACARHLVDQGFTSSDRLVAEGGSAGGLLMGAIANLAPEAFRAIHASVPFVDPLTSILDPDLPLTVTEWEEWGDPLHDPEVYGYIRAYSPYENVRATAYPSILATTSLNDTRVLYVEPAKWVAALREKATNGTDRPILLKTEMVAGHGGASGRYRAWREHAFEYAWLIDQATQAIPGRGHQTTV